MRVGRLTGPGSVGLEETPEPHAGPGEVTVRLAACGVCGTDLEKLRGGYRASTTIGHEPVGRIAELGAGVDRLAVGDRVFVHHHVPCYACDICARGDFTFCPTYARTNLDPGGFAEVIRVPMENVARGAVLPLAANVGWDSGTLLEPAGCALTAIRRVGLPAHARAFVLGLGPVGLLYARLLRALGAAWVGGTEVSAVRRAAAERGGIDVALDPRDDAAVRAAVDRGTDRGGVDLAVVATSHPSAIRSATELVRRGGTVNLFGVPPHGSRLEADLQDLYLRGIRIVPSYATTEPDIAEVHRRVADGSLALGDLVSHRYPLSEIADAFAMAGRPTDALKVTVTGPEG